MRKFFHNIKSTDKNEILQKIEKEDDFKINNIDNKNTPTKNNLNYLIPSHDQEEKGNNFETFDKYEKNSPSKALSFLKKKRKDYEDRDKDHLLHLMSNHGTASKFLREERRGYLDEKITDFFKYKKPKKTDNIFKCTNSDDEESCNSSVKNLKSINENQGIVNVITTINGNSPTKESPKKRKMTKQRLERNIKDYFKEFKLSTKTLCTLRKGNFLSTQPDLILPSSKQHMSLDLGQLPITSSKKNEKNHKDIDEILKSLSMRDKYEGLLNRELILPPIYKLLLLQFEFLDHGILDIKFQKNSKVNFDSLSYYMKEKDFRIGLNLEDFQKMLQIFPSGFLYKYEPKKNASNLTNRYDVIIDIPNDFQQRLKNNYSNFNTAELHKLQSLESHKGLETPPVADSISQRSKAFKQALINFTKIQHDKFLKKRGIKFDAVKYSTWHSEFNLDEVDKIKTFQMIPKPTKKANRI